MKILAFVDIHGNLSAVKKIIKKSEEADLLVCAGDLTNWGTHLELIIKMMLDSKKILIAIHGNHETPDDFKLLQFDNLKFIHRAQLKVNDFTFFGFGGGGFSQRDIEFENAVKKIKFNRRLILVTHAPPYGTKLDMLPIGHCGNKSIRNFIEDKQPMLHICGHLHENAGKKDKIGNTKVINPGSEGIFIEI